MSTHLWPVEFRANGEWNAGGDLTDVQIQAVTAILEAFELVNKLTYKGDKNNG